MKEWGLRANVYENIAEVGAVFEGEIERPASHDKDPVRGVRIVLIVRSSGEGDPDERRVAGIELQVEPDGRVASRFQLPVPEEGPVSYNGRLLRVQWRMEFTIDVRRRPDEVFDYPVLVVPHGGLGLYSGPHPLLR